MLSKPPQCKPHVRAKRKTFPPSEPVEEQYAFYACTHNPDGTITEYGVTLGNFEESAAFLTDLLIQLAEQRIALKDSHD